MKIIGNTVGTTMNPKKVAEIVDTSNALKGSASGELISLSDVSPLEHLLKVGVRSKNLFPSFSEQTLDGVTLSKVNGYYVLNGTASNSGFFSKETALQNGVYTISASNPAHNGNQVALVQAYSASQGSNIVAYDNEVNSKQTKELKFATDYQCRIRYEKGVVYNNFIVKPQLELGTSATNYTPFVEVQNTALKASGKNLLPVVPYENTKTENGITFTLNDDNSLHIKGTATADVSFRYVSENNASRKPIKKGSYTISGADGLNKSDRITIGITGISEYYCHVADGKRTIEVEEDGTFYFKVSIMNGSTLDVTIYPQLELGNTATDYEPPKEPVSYTPNADGTVDGVKSIAPTMVLRTDTAGVVIDAEYNRDLNKAFGELLQRVAALETSATVE